MKNVPGLPVDTFYWPLCHRVANKSLFFIPILLPAGISSPYQQIQLNKLCRPVKKKSTKMKYAVKMFEMSQAAAANEPVLVPKLMQFI